MPSWGKISDIFGRKPILLLANVVFLIGSLICGLSINIKMLLAGRAIQGIGGGGLLSLVNISIGDLFSMRYAHITRPSHFEKIRGLILINGYQNTEYLLWHGGDGMGCCRSPWPCYWRCLYAICLMALVLLCKP